MSRDDKPQFIELSQHSTGARITVNTDRILTVSRKVGDSTVADPTLVLTEITLAGGSPYAPSRVLAQEDYDQVRRLMGLDWLTCGEMLRTGPNVSDVCDRRLDKEGRCPIHGLVGA